MGGVLLRKIFFNKMVTLVGTYLKVGFQFLQYYRCPLTDGSRRANIVSGTFNYLTISRLRLGDYKPIFTEPKAK